MEKVDPDKNPQRAPPPRHAMRLVVALGVVSVGGAAFAMAFRAALQLVYRTLLGGSDVLQAFSALPFWWKLFLPAIGGLLAGCVGRWTSRAGTQGVGDVMEAVVIGRVRLSVRKTAWKALGSWFAIATGNSIGREGPLIQFGGSLGSAVAEKVGVSTRDAKALIAAGTAAGFAAAYNTPFAAVLFVLEVVTGVVALEALMMVMVATAVATTIVRASVGGGPIYGQRAFAIGSAWELGAHFGLGIAAAVVASFFMAMLSFGERLFERTQIGQPWRAATGGLVVGAIATVLPQVVGNGYEPLNHVLDAHYGAALVFAILVAKIVATVSSVSSGNPGGVFTPSLLIGGALGTLWGQITAGVLGTASMGSYALVGMAAVTAATTHAPLMSAVLVFELSGDYAIVVPLLLATAVATFVARRLRPDSIYTAELRRRGIAWRMTLEGRRVGHARSNGPGERT